MADTEQVTAEQVLAIVQQRFPREWEIAVQQAYIANLEAALKERDGSAAERAAAQATLMGDAASNEVAE